MALGSGFGDFKPKAVNTASELLKTSAVQPSRKESLINVRVNADVVKCFKELCEKSGTTMSDEIRRFIITTVANSDL